MSIFTRRDGGTSRKVNGRGCCQPPPVPTPVQRGWTWLNPSKNDEYAGRKCGQQCRLNSKRYQHVNASEEVVVNAVEACERGRGAALGLQ